MPWFLCFLIPAIIACNPASDVQQVASSSAILVLAGSKISGNFSGNQPVTATVVQTIQGSGNPVEDGTPDAYEIQFSGKILPVIPIGCCEAILINEGNLTGSGDALSVYQAPMNGCTYTFTTYDFSGKKPRKIIGPVLIPTACKPVSDKALQDRVFKEGDQVYYYETDPDSERGELVKVSATGF